MNARHALSRVFRLLSTLWLALLGAGWAGGAAASAAGANAPPGASVTAPVQVPAALRTAPFDVPRSLTVPPGFTISVYTRISGARFMVLAPNGDLLVSQPGAGKVSLLRPNPGGLPALVDFATGLNSPHGLAFDSIAGTTYLYIAESNQIDRYVYHLGDTTAQNRQIIIAGLPDSGHGLKNIVLDGQHKLYVSIGSSCNVCLSDTTSTPVRGAIYQYDANGGNGRLFARGIRNAEGLAIAPGTSNALWVAGNHRDNVPYPYNDGTGQYGKVIPAYVDNHPPDIFTHVRDGGNYGWPFCNPNPDTPAGYHTMPYDRDYDLNADGHVDCGTIDRTNLGLQAHSAPLGLHFWTEPNAPAAYAGGAVIGIHGSWNRTTPTGYKVIYVPWNRVAQTPGDPINLVTGWLDPATQQPWGRPVAAVADRLGNLFISDDLSGAIYKLTPTTPNPTPAFSDLPANDPAYQAVTALARRGVIRGYGNGQFGPADLVMRAQVAAIVARASSWDAENHGNDFADQGPIDADLWRNVGTLAFYDVARGYGDGAYRPTSPVLHIQVISLIARTMEARGLWLPQPDRGDYANVPADSGARGDLATYVYYAGAVVDRPVNQPWSDWNTPATRGWTARVFWQALTSYYGPAGVP
ncbi:MAG: S-layer homology domain-containing protein [Thermomicrobiales bacterium]